MSIATISGAVSGLDTASIINGLVSVQANQQTLLRSQQTGVQKRSDALSALSTSLTSFSSLAADLAKTSAWSGSTTTSSSSSVTATAKGTVSASFSFDVTSVARAHSLISADTVSSTGSVVASGPLTLTTSTGSTTVEIGTGSLGDVVSAINASGAGVTAAAVQTAPGAYRLQLTAKSTGAASSFTVDGLDGFSGTNVLSEGSDATIHVGTNPDTAYDVTSSTNTFSNLVPGLSFTVGKVESGVTVSSTIDGSAVADKVSGLVDAANGILSSIATNTRWDATKRTGGPLTGESSVRALQQNILSIVSGGATPGVQLTRDGRLSFDKQAFLDAFAADPSAVAKKFGGDVSLHPGAGTTGTAITLSNALKSARAGTYDIQVTSLPAREQWSLGAPAEGQVVQLTRGSSTVSYTATADDTADTVAANLTARLAAAGFGATATSDGAGGLLLTADNVGAGPAFTATLDGTDGSRTSAGADIAGTIDGQAATTGVGSVLSLATGASGANGLSIQVSTTAEDVAATGGAIGSVTYIPGLAQQFVSLVSAATGDGGTITSAKSGADTEVKRFQSDIDAWDTRLSTYRTTLTRQFTAMETALAALKSQTAALSGLTSSTSSTSSGSSG